MDKFGPLTHKKDDTFAMTIPTRSRTKIKYLTWLAPLTLSVLLLSACDSSDDLTRELNTQQWPIVETCDLHHQACSAQNAQQSVTLTITPQPIPIARPLNVSVKLDNLTADKVELDISGVNMYMGFNRVALTPNPKQKGEFVGTSMLAFCTIAKMQWQVTVMIHQADGTQIQVPYLLETSNR